MSTIVRVLSNFDGEFRIPVFDDADSDLCPCVVIPDFPTWSFCFRERCFSVQMTVDGVLALDVVIDACDLKYGMTISRFLSTFRLVGKDRLCFLRLSSRSPNLPGELLLKMLEPGLKVHYRSLVPAAAGPRDGLALAMSREIKSRLLRVPTTPKQIVAEATYFLPLGVENACVELPETVQLTRSGSSTKAAAVDVLLLSPDWDLVHSCELGFQMAFRPDERKPAPLLCAAYHTDSSTVVYDLNAPLETAEADRTEEKDENDDEQPVESKERARSTAESPRRLCLRICYNHRSRDLFVDEVFDFAELKHPGLARTGNAVSIRIIRHFI